MQPSKSWRRRTPQRKRNPKRPLSPFEALNSEQPEEIRDAEEANPSEEPSFGEPEEEIPDVNDANTNVELNLDVVVQRVDAESPSEVLEPPEDELTETFIVSSEERVAAEIPNPVDAGDAWSLTTSRKSPPHKEAVAETKQVSWSLEAEAVTRVEKSKLQLEVSGPKLISLGDKFQVRFRVTNRAEVESEVVSINADLPEGLFHRKGRALIYEIGRLRAGKSTDVYLTIRAEKVGIIAHRAELIAQGKVFEPTTTRIKVVARTNRRKQTRAASPRSVHRDSKFSLVRRR